jgi:hypothetical protein
MPGTLVITTLSDGTNSTSATNCIQGSAKAWVNFNGTGTVTIQGSYNVSSITDNAAGNYRVNFTNAMPNTNYAFNICCNGNGNNYQTFQAMLDGTKAVGSFGIFLNNLSAAGVDASEVSLSIFR